MVEFRANLVGLNWLNLALNLTLNLTLNSSPRGFLGRPRLGGGIYTDLVGLNRLNLTLNLALKGGIEFFGSLGKSTGYIFIYHSKKYMAVQMVNANSN